MHLKYQISFLHDAGCPALRDGDIAIFISGTGTTSGVVNQARIAKKLGANVILITSKKREQLTHKKPDSIENYVNLIIEVGGKTKEQKIQPIYEFGSRQIAGASSKNIQTADGILVLGTQFEINALVFLMGLCYSLMLLLNKSEESLLREHKNVE